jgi:hypothetical protein
MALDELRLAQIVDVAFVSNGHHQSTAERQHSRYSLLYNVVLEAMSE